MSQVFSADAQMRTSNLANDGDNDQDVLTTNPLQPPYETCKAKVVAILSFLVPTGATSVSVDIVRNPDSENLIVEGTDQAAVAGERIVVAVGVIDKIPDGRAVAYVGRIAWTNSSANDGATLDGSYIESTLISG